MVVRSLRHGADGCAPERIAATTLNKIKHCRRVATRYDKLAANYRAFVKLACIRLWLWFYGFTT